MGMFDGMKSDGLEKTEDRLGGGGYLLDTDIYTGKIKLAYATKSDGGAQAIVVEFLPEGSDKPYRETLWFTNRKGENFYTTDNNKKAALPGFVTINDLCLATTEKELCEQDTEEKVVKIYDYDKKAEVPTSVPVLVEMLGQEVSLAIFRNTVNKTEKGDDGKYHPIADTKDENVIAKVFHHPTKLTMVEAREKKPAEFFDAWKDKYQGQTQDRTKKDLGGGTKSGRPGGNAPQSGSGGERKSLFDK